jgi:hypothetical protein
LGVEFFIEHILDCVDRSWGGSWSPLALDVAVLERYPPHQVSDAGRVRVKRGFAGWTASEGLANGIFYSIAKPLTLVDVDRPDDDAGGAFVVFVQALIQGLKLGDTSGRQSTQRSDKGQPEEDEGDNNKNS